MYDEYDIVDETNLIILDYIEKNNLLENSNALEIVDAVDVYKLIPNSKNNNLNNYDFRGMRIYKFNSGDEEDKIVISYGKLDSDTMQNLLGKSGISPEDIEELRNNSKNKRRIVENKSDKSKFIEHLKSDMVRNQYLVMHLAETLGLDTEKIIMDYKENQNSNTDKIEDVKKINNYNLEQIKEQRQQIANMYNGSNEDSDDLKPKSI